MTVLVPFADDENEYHDVMAADVRPPTPKHWDAFHLCAEQVATVVGQPHQPETRMPHVLMNK